MEYNLYSLALESPLILGSPPCCIWRGWEREKERERVRSDVNENLSVVSGREGHKKEKSWKRKNKIEMGDLA